MGTLGCARQTDSIKGNAPGEHHGHACPPDGVCHPGSNPLTGNIITGSTNVFCNGLPIARVSDKTQESDPCGPGSGSVGIGSSTVFCNGRPVARLTDEIHPHHGYATITSASGNVFVG